MVRLEYTPLLYGLVMAGIDVFMLSIIKTVSTAPAKFIRWMVIPTLIYALQPWIFLSSLKYESLIVMNLMWDVLSDILVTFVGLVYFREKIGPYKTLGVILSFVSITLLSMEDGNWEDFLPIIQNGKS
jgi:drug/metabolite transporter (DMT)-like permease